MRNILDATPKQLQKELYPRVRAILEAPDLETARLLIGALLMEIDEKWASGKKYLDMAEYLE